MTPTFESNKQRQIGVTLFELLVVLALFTFMAMLASGSVRASSPHLAVKLSSEQLLADLRRARIESDAANSPVTISFTDNGYHIAALDIDRRFPRGVAAEIAGGGDEITIGRGFWLRRYHIDLSKKNARAAIIIDPITRRMSLL